MLNYRVRKQGRQWEAFDRLTGVRGVGGTVREAVEHLERERTELFDALGIFKGVC